MEYPYPIADLPRERRDESERRRFSYRTLLQGLRYRRRRNVRRQGEPAYIDVYPTRFRYLVLSILALSCLDALLTLNLLDAGAVELNPIMAVLIETDLSLFLFAKTLITAVCATVLVVYANVRLFRLRGERYLNLAVLSYLVLIGWELVLLGRVAGIESL